MNKRIIPILLLNNGSLVKSRNFQRAKYIGDPINTIRIFNELEADEIIILDISSHESNFKINFKILRDIASESFIPMSYGGGINSIQAIHDVLNIGFEKVVLNSSCINNPNLKAWESWCAGFFGSSVSFLLA